MFASCAFGYYRQLLDPASVANAWRAPVRQDFNPHQYAPPYSGPNTYPAHAPYPPAGPTYGGSNQGSWAPPPGPPPEGKPPGYENWGYGAGNAGAKDPFGDPHAERPERGDGR